MAAPIARPRAPRLLRAAKAPATTPPPLDGVWAPGDTRIDDTEVFTLPHGRGPEDVAIDASDRVVAGAEDGTLWRWAAGTPEAFANTGGRPLGIELDPRDGSLIVCDAWRGLLRVTDDGAITDLTRTAAGTPILFCNNASVARDGVVYFSDSSKRFPLSAWKRDLLEYRPNGRILAYDPASGETSVVADGLYFPNGVALTPDESALLVAATTTHRLMRVSLPDGAVTELADFPAYPDNMSAVGDGTYWIALASPRVAAAERVLPFPRLRTLVALLPDFVQPQPKPYSLASLVDSDGRVLRVLHGPAGRYRMLTGVRQHGDELWFGSLTEHGIGRVSLT
jgi:sugar lactone lactonase YvrE